MTPARGEALRFLLAGGANTAFSYAAYAVFAAGFGWGYAPSIVASWGLSVLFSYATFSGLVFTGGARGAKSFLRFLPVYGAILFINLAALHLLTARLGLGKLAAQALCVPPLALLSFFLNRTFVFRTGRGLRL